MSFHSDGKDAVLSNDRRPDRANDLSFRIEAGEAPVCQFSIASGQGVVWDARSILLADSTLKFGQWPGAGHAMQLMVNADRTKAARMLVGSLWGGPLGAFDLQRHGGRLLCPRQSLAGVGPGVATSAYARLGAVAGAEEDDGFDMLRVEGDGWLFLSAAGRVIEQRLAPAETVAANTFCLVAMTATVDVDAVEAAGASGPVRDRFVRLTGPGRIWLQSVEGGRTHPGRAAASPRREAGRRRSPSPAT